MGINKETLFEDIILKNQTNPVPHKESLESFQDGEAGDSVEELQKLLTKL